MAVERFSLQLDAKTVGLEDAKRLEETLNRVLGMAEKSRAVGDSVRTSTDRASAGNAQFGQSVAQFIRDPLGSASAAAEGFIGKLGPMGVALGGAGAAAIAAGAAVISWIKSTGDAAEKILNLSITTGLTAKEVQLFSGALELSGASIADLEKASVKLNSQLADTGEAGQKARKALADIGVSLYDTNGRLKEAGPLILDLSRGLSAVSNRAERDRIGVDLLGKSYRALIPAFTELGSNVETLRRLGIGIDEKSLQKADQLADKMSLLAQKFEQATFQVKQLVTQLANPVFDQLLKPSTATTGAVIGFGVGALGLVGGLLGAGLAQPVFEGSDKAIGRTFAADPVVAGILNRGLSGGSTIESQRQQLTDLRNQIDSQRQKLAQFAATPGLTEAAATREVAALKGLEAQYRNLEASIEAAEKAKRDFEKLNALGTFTVTDQFFAPEQFRQQFAGSSKLNGGPLAFLNEGSFGTTGVGIVVRPTPSLRRGAERQFPAGLGSFTISESDITAANVGAAAAGTAQNRALGAGLIAASQQADQVRLQSVRDTLAFETERLRLIAGPGGELAAIKAIATLRLDAAQKELAITGNLREFDQQRLQIERDRQIEALRFAKERDDKNRQTGGQVFDALVAGGSGLRGFGSGLVLGFGRQIFGNTFAELARGTSGLLQLPGQVGPDGKPNFLGRALAGTPFGLDPAKVALDLNTIATQQNTAALLGGRATSALSDLPSTIFGGAGANPLIFSAAPGRSPGIMGADGLPLGIAGQGLNVPRFGLSATQKIGAIAGIAGGGFLVKSGIQQGGLAGALDVGAGGLGALGAALMLAGVSGPAAPIVAGVALGLQVVKGLLPDPRKARAREIDRLVNGSAVDLGDTVGIDTDFSRGGTVAANKGGIVVIQQINAADSKSFLDRRDDIAAAVTQAIDEGNSRLREGIMRTVDQGVV